MTLDDPIEPFRAEFERLVETTDHRVFVQCSRWSWRHFKRIEVCEPLDPRKHPASAVMCIVGDPYVRDYAAALAVGRAAKTLHLAMTEGPDAALLWKLSQS
jgi:hypothetical protein